MPNIKNMKESKFLKQDDCGAGILVTISAVVKQNVALAGQPPEEKWTLQTHEAKPLVLNSTNLKKIAKICKSDETDEWIGKQIVLYADEDVEYAGETVGGIRAREPRGQAARATPAPAPAASDADDSDLPF